MIGVRNVSTSQGSGGSIDIRNKMFKVFSNQGHAVAGLVRSGTDKRIASDHTVFFLLVVFPSGLQLIRLRRVIAHFSA